MNPQFKSFTSSVRLTPLNQQARNDMTHFTRRTVTIPTTTTTTTTKTPLSTSTSVTVKPLPNQQLNQFELKNVRPLDQTNSQAMPTKIPFVVDETVEDLGIIKYPVPEILKKTKVFGQLQDRKLFLEHACKYSKGLS